MKMFSIFCPAMRECLSTSEPGITTVIAEVKAGVGLWWESSRVTWAICDGSFLLIVWYCLLHLFLWLHPACNSLRTATHPKDSNQFSERQGRKHMCQRLTGTFSQENTGGKNIVPVPPVIILMLPLQADRRRLWEGSRGNKTTHFDLVDYSRSLHTFIVGEAGASKFFKTYFFSHLYCLQ